MKKNTLYMYCISYSKLPWKSQKVGVNQNQNLRRAGLSRCLDVKMWILYLNAPLRRDLLEELINTLVAIIFINVISASAFSFTSWCCFLAPLSQTEALKFGNCNWQLQSSGSLSIKAKRKFQCSLVIEALSLWVLGQVEFPVLQVSN